MTDNLEEYESWIEDLKVWESYQDERKRIIGEKRNTHERRKQNNTLSRR